MALTSKLSAIGDAIRAKTGGTELLTLDAMVTAIDGIQTGGGDSLADEIISGTVTELTSNSTKVRDYAFKNCASITTVQFPMATSISAYAFSGCGSLAYVDFPVVNSIGTGAFSSCSSLTSVSFPEVTKLEYDIFYGLESLSNADFPKVTSIAGSCFKYCKKLKTVNFPKVESVKQEAFASCFALTSISLPEAQNIHQSAFSGCTSLSSLVLGRNAVCTLNNINALSYTLIETGTGYIYVPDALVDSYKTATNWSTYASQIKPLSEYAG